MQYCPQCRKMTEATASPDGSGTLLCVECSSVIPERRVLLPGTIINGFSIVKEIGRGGMGVVYLAQQVNLERYVAVKVLDNQLARDEEFVTGFFREARAAASLSHPNIVQAYDAGITDDGIYYFVMELIDGENLDRYIAEYGALNIQKALEVARNIAGALAYSWERQHLSHGDIKPENIVMKLNGEIKLADLGLARDYKKDRLKEGELMATPAYAPPEVIRGEIDKIGFKSDMYSYGATLYHLFAGVPPFPGDDPGIVCQMQLNNQPRPLIAVNKDIPINMSILVDQLMEKAPSKRPESWREVANRVDKIQEEYIAKKEDQQTKMLSAHNREMLNRKVIFMLSSAFLVILALLIILGVYAASITKKKNRLNPAKGNSAQQILVQDKQLETVQETEEQAKERIGQTTASAAWNAIKDRLDPQKAVDSLKMIDQYFSGHGKYAAEEAFQARNEYREKAKYERTFQAYLQVNETTLKLLAKHDISPDTKQDILQEINNSVRKLLGLTNQLEVLAKENGKEIVILSPEDRQKFNDTQKKLTQVLRIKQEQQEQQKRLLAMKQKDAEKRRQEQEKARQQQEQEKQQEEQLYQQVLHNAAKHDMDQLKSCLSEWDLCEYRKKGSEEHNQSIDQIRNFCSKMEHFSTNNELNERRSGLSEYVWITIDNVPLYFNSIDKTGIRFFRYDSKTKIGIKKKWDELPRRSASSELAVLYRIAKTKGMMELFGPETQSQFFRRMVFLGEPIDNLQELFAKNSLLAKDELRTLVEECDFFKVEN